MLSKVISILGVLVLMFVLVVAAALGMWAYSLNSQLAQIHGDHENLKSSYEDLNQDYSDLKAGSAKTGTELTAAQAQVEALQAQLKKAQADNDALKTKMSAIQDKVTILYALEFASEATIEAKVKASSDEQLKALWAKANKSQSDKDWYNLWDYVVQSVADAMGLSMLPNQLVNGALIDVAPLAS